MNINKLLPNNFKDFLLKYGFDTNNLKGLTNYSSIGTYYLCNNIYNLDQLIFNFNTTNIRLIFKTYYVFTKNDPNEILVREYNSTNPTSHELYFDNLATDGYWWHMIKDIEYFDKEFLYMDDSSFMSDNKRVEVIFDAIYKSALRDNKINDLL